MSSDPLDTELPLLLGYLRNELTPEETGQLEARLMSDDELVRKLVRVAVEESILCEWAAGVQRIKEVDEAERKMGPARPRFSSRKQSAVSARNRASVLKKSFWSSSGIYAAAAMLLVAAGVALWLSQSGHSPSGAPIAKVVAAKDAVWSSKSIRLGSAIPAGAKLELVSGSAELEYFNGAHVYLDGPSEYELSSALSAKLRRGKLTAYAPPTASNFTVQTLSVDVVDKGTRFGVRAGTEGTEVHVFEGAVETNSHDAENKKPSKQSLSMLQAVKFNPSGKLIDWVAPDYAGYGSARQVPGVISTSRHVTWLAKAPTSLEEGKLVSDDKIYLIPEKRDVALPYDLVTTFFPGKGTRSVYNDNNIRMLAAGTHVDSYILHRETSSSAKFLDGSVTFDRPILAIVARGKHLLISDKVMGLPGTIYESKNTTMRGLDTAKSGSGPDVLQFSESTNKISVRFENQADDTMDEIRILVASAKPDAESDK